VKSSVRTPRVVEEQPTSVVTLPLTDLDRAALDEMARMTGASIVNVIRIALWHYAHHLDTSAAPGLFGCRRAEPAHAARH
jgi:hypothetical protein